MYTYKKHMRKIWLCTVNICLYILINNNGIIIQHEFDYCLEYFLNIQNFTSDSFGDTFSHLHDPSSIKKKYIKYFGKSTHDNIQITYIWLVLGLGGAAVYLSGHVMIRLPLSGSDPIHTCFNGCERQKCPNNSVDFQCLAVGFRWFL